MEWLITAAVLAIAYRFDRAKVAMNGDCDWMSLKALVCMPPIWYGLHYLF